ncbi:ABC transporter substrate binding protein [Clostridium sp. JNZ J1-5]
MTKTYNQMKYIFILLLFCLLISLYKTNSFATESHEKHVLILNSYHKDVQWSDDIVEGITSVIKNGEKNINIHIEYMDTKNFHDNGYIDSLYNFYKTKYKNKKFDVIISTDNSAFDFLSKYSDALFQDTPIVFCGVNYFQDSMIKNRSNITGVVEDISLKETLDIALKLNSNIQNVIVISSNSSTGTAVKKSLDQIIPNYKKQNLNFIFMDDTNFFNSKAKIDELSKNSIALMLSGYTSYYKDHIHIEDGAGLVLTDYSIPVYASWDCFLNYGVVGGKVISGKNTGEIAGKLAYRVLHGEKPSNIEIIKKNDSKYIFDYKQLKRFNISPTALPYDSTIINLPIASYVIPKKFIFVFIIFVMVLFYFLALSIRKRHEAKAALSESEQRLRTLINSSPALICLKDQHGRWLETNKSTLEFFNIDPNEWRGKTDAELLAMDNVYKEGLLKCKNFDNLAFKKGEIVSYTERFDKENEEFRVYDFIKVPIVNPNSNIKSLVTIGQNITSHIKAQEDKKLLNELVEYDNLRTEFFANLSHELRTPLNVILSALQYIEVMHEKDMLKYESINSFDKYSSIMKQNCYRLLRIVNNLIDMTKIDAGYFELNLENYNIIDVVEEISMSVASYAEDNGLSLTFDTELEEKIIACDANIIERILLNLISNAIKFTNPGGQIFINIYDKGESVQISVKDTGIGISKSKQKLIFERFVQVDKSLSRNHEGSGIGLSLVKSLVEMHGGSIDIISEPKKGSEFIITLPVYTIPDKEIKLYSDSFSYLSNDERVNVEFSDIYL